MPLWIQAFQWELQVFPPRSLTQPGVDRAGADSTDQGVVSEATCKTGLSVLLPSSQRQTLRKTFFHFASKLCVAATRYVRKPSTL